LRVLAGVVEARRGRVRRGSACTYVPDRVALPNSLHARRWLRLMDAGHAPLEAELQMRIGNLSKGQLQRVALTSVLDGTDGRARLLVLDEPWSGLDVTACRRLGERLAKCAAIGCAIVFTDHSGLATVAPTRALVLDGASAPNGRGSADLPSRAVRLVLVRDGERDSVVVDDAQLAVRLAEGWIVEGAEKAC
jgi:energy-coupling factor transporter ATP-binding protein EcfA2